MADTPLTYNDIEDIKFNPFANGGVGEFLPTLQTEIRTVPATAPYVIKLYEVPYQYAPSTTFVEEVASGVDLLEVGKSTSPANRQYHVCYFPDQNAGLVEFNENQAGLQMRIRYSGIGHCFQRISLDTRVPNTGNTDIDGIKTFIGGLTRFDQGSNDDSIINLISSDVDHGITDIVPTDVYGTFLKKSIANGGLKIIGLTESVNSGLDLEGIINASGNTYGAITIEGNKKNGTSKVGLLATDIILTVFSSGVPGRMDIMGNGKIVAATGGIVTKYSEANITIPPTDAELDAAFGAPAVVGNGFIGVIDDAGAHTNFYLCFALGGKWLYQPFTIAV